MRYYTLDVLERMYRRDYPDLPDSEIKKKAKQLHKQLNILDVQWKRNNRRFYQVHKLV